MMIQPTRVVEVLVPGIGFIIICCAMAPWMSVCHPCSEEANI